MSDWEFGTCVMMCIYDDLGDKRKEQIRDDGESDDDYIYNDDYDYADSKNKDDGEEDDT